MRPITRAMSTRFASSLTRRIVFLNLGGLVALAIGFLYVNQFREGLIDARVQSLETQGEIIAAAISASASVETDAITVDPEKLLQPVPGQGVGAADDGNPSLEFSINPERIGPVLRRLVLPTRTRARIFDREGYLLLDSRSLSRRGAFSRQDPTVRQEAAGSSDEALTLIARTWNAVKGRFGKSETPRGEEFAGHNARSFPEVAGALNGTTQNVVRVNAKGDTIISVAVPIQRMRAVKGALLLSTLGGDIDGIIATERWAIVRIFLVSAVIMFLLSSFLAGTIAEPMRRLAEASDRVRRGTKSRQEIPDFTYRADEIGHLSGSLRDMTKALYNRIEAIERFAADVAHELKNPLTSLRSAVETMPVARTKNAQDRLLAIIQHDVKRLDRLISDISDASRLDAELARADNQEVDLPQVLEAVVAVANGTGRDGVRISLDIARPPTINGEPSRLLVLGYDSRLGQVFNNLIDNARSFSAQGGSVRVTMRRVTSRPRPSFRTASLRTAGHARARHGTATRSSSTMTDPASRPTPSRGSSSASTRTGPSKASARTRASACRSRARSWRCTAARSARPTASMARVRTGTTSGTTPVRLMIRTGRRRFSAPASPCGFRPLSVTAPKPTQPIHASAVSIGGRGLLILGPSRSGKSRLACALIAASRPTRPIVLIGDDRILLSTGRNSLVARPHPRIAGFIERRGLGIVASPHADEAPVAGYIELDRPFASMASVRDLAGSGLPNLAIARLDDARQAAIDVLDWWDEPRNAT